MLSLQVTFIHNERRLIEFFDGKGKKSSPFAMKMRDVKWWNSSTVIKRNLLYFLHVANFFSRNFVNQNSWKIP